MLRINKSIVTLKKKKKKKKSTTLSYRAGADLGFFAR